MKRLTLPIAVIVTILVSNFLTACSLHFNNSSNNLDLIMEKSFPIEEGKDLRVRGQSGDIIVTTWDKAEVYFKILGNEKAKDRFEFNFDSDDSYVELVTESKGTFSNWFGGASLRIEVKIPERFNTMLHTSGGDIKLAGAEGEHQLKTSGGDIDCKDFRGSLNASTSGGDINLNCSNTLVTAHTSGGDIDLDYSGENLGIDLSTSGGDITTRLPSDFNASMEISTSGGDVSCSLTMNNATKLSGHKIIADLNDGGKKFYAHTSGGDIDVMKK
jgi:hypothetical protein